MATLHDEVQKLRERLERLEELVLPPEPFVAKPRKPIAEVGADWMPPSAVAEMAAAVSDTELAAIRNDLLKPPTLPTVPAESPTGRGWIDPVPDREPLNIDAMVEAMVGGPNDTSKLK
jgi:hypothetical protein